MRKLSPPTKARVILGITGSIAAYKGLELARHLKKEGDDVYVVMTKSAKQFITPLSFKTLTNNPVFSEMFYKDKQGTKPIHIDLARDASAIVVAPATANIIAKVAAGIADDLLSSIILAASSPVIFVPAMNVRMWESPITQRNIQYLKSLGFRFVEPEIGELACEEIGKGRFPNLEQIGAELKAVLNKNQLLKDKKIVITTGRTEEPIDPIRVLTNRSSGKMGIEIAKAAKRQGAHVILISGNVSIPLPVNINTKKVSTTQAMLDAVRLELDNTDILIMTAAVCDYRPSQSFTNKQKKDELILKLTRTQDILKIVSQEKHNAFVVGFSLDTDNNIREAKRKLKVKNLDMIVANPLVTLEEDIIKPTIIFKNTKAMRMPMQSKKEFAEKLITIISKEIKK